jgi:hypothetical protein
MARCAACGVDNAETSSFCFNCGAALPGKVAAQSAARGAAPPKPDPVGLAGFALFLVVAGFVVAGNPGVFAQFLDWTREWAQVGVPLRPPAPLLASAVLFFGLSGLSAFARAAIRLAVSGLWVRAIGDVMSALASLAFAYLVSRYEAFALAGSQVLAIEAVVVGVLIFAYVSIGLTWGFARRTGAAPRPEARR